jgi:RNA polymerase sigma factor (sigma-70 family)
MDVQASMEEYAPALAIRIIRNGLVDWLRSRKFNYSVRGVVEHISWDAYLKAWNEYTESFWNNEYGSSIPQFPSFEDEVIERLEIRERIQNAGLTKRERNIMGLRLLGYSNEEIAIKRKCSSSNVRHALLDIRRKMGGEKE